MDDVITKDWDINTSFSCDCSSSEFCDPHHGHVVTGNLKIIKDRKLRSLLCKGPTFREAKNANWDKYLENVKSSLDACVQQWALSKKVDVEMFQGWKTNVMSDVNSKVAELRCKRFKRRRSVLNSPKIKRVLEKLQEDFVFVPTDKASNNIAVVCKKFYIQKSLEELGIFDESKSVKKDGSTYVAVDKSRQEIIKNHIKYTKSNLNTDDIPESFPFLYWIPKMHKKPFSKQRFIAASFFCTTKPLSAVLTKCLKLVEKQHKIICHRFFRDYGINPMWILHNSTSVHDLAANFNRKKNARNVRTYDFSTLYTSIPHDLLKRQLAWVIKKAFKSSGKTFISVYKSGASWTNSPKKNTLALDCKKFIRVLNWLIDNIYVTFGDQCFRQVIGIPMGTDCAPFLANLFLFSYEFKWIDKQRKEKNHKVLQLFRSCGRYIDDLCLINNNDLMKEVMADIYPKELELVPDDTDGLSCPFLDLNIIIKDHIISTSIYDKRDAFDFPIVNFPTLTGNIPLKSAYGVFVGELVRYARACTYYDDFSARTKSLINKLMKQAFTFRKLKASYFKFVTSHFLLVQKYGSRILSFPGDECD